MGTQTFNKVVIRWENAFAIEHFVGWSDDGVNFYGYNYSIDSPDVRTYNLGSHTARYIGIFMYTQAPGFGNFSFWEMEVYNTDAMSGETALEATPISDLVSLRRDLE
jgi:hypothetical protein